MDSRDPNTATATTFQVIVSSAKDASSQAEMTRADRDTQVESTQKLMILNQEYKNVKQYAKTRMLQKNERNLFRPKTGFTSYTNRQPPRARNQATRGGFKSAVHTRASSNVPHLKELRSSVLPNRGADSHALSMNAFSP